MFNGIIETLHREIHDIEERVNNGGKFNEQDLNYVDKMAHALKCLATYEAMEGHSETGDSYARGRSRTTGRYISRTGEHGQVEYGREMDPYYDRRY